MPILNCLNGNGTSTSIDTAYSPFLFSAENGDGRISSSARNGYWDISYYGITFSINMTCIPIETFQARLEDNNKTANVVFTKGKKYTRGVNGGIYEDGVLFFDDSTSTNAIKVYYIE